MAVDLDRVDVVAKPETLKLAAAITVRDYDNWVRSSKLPAAIFGRKELAPRIGATVDTNPLQSSLRYVRMTRTEGDLPRLLGDYLAAYDEVMLA